MIRCYKHTSTANLTLTNKTVFAQPLVFVTELKHYADDEEQNERKLFHWTVIW